MTLGSRIEILARYRLSKPRARAHAVVQPGRLVPLFAIVPVVFTSCAERMPQNTFDPAGEGARDIANLITPVFFVAAAIFVIVQTLLLVSVFRFRDKGDSEGRAPRQVHGHTLLEIIWTIIPFLILVGVAVPTVKLIGKQHRVPQGPGVLEVKVTAHQWWWEFEYPQEGVITANELHIPAGNVVKLTLTSADVVHSFWVPRLAGKQDVIPGQERTLTIKADRPESEPIYGQCAEFCGASHANMRLRTIVQTDADFRAWLESQKQPPAVPAVGSKAAEGQRIFQTGACIGCHTIAGTNARGRVGPDLTHFASRSTFAGSIFESNDENLRLWLHDPPGVKPGSKMPNLGLSDAEVENLIAYLQSLK